MPWPQSAPTASTQLGLDAPKRLRSMLEQHFRFIFRSLRRLGVQPADLDDATQRVFIVASDNLERIEPDKERAFLFGTATRVAANARRAQSNRLTLQSDSERNAAAVSAPAPDELLERKQSRALLDSVLDELPADLRAIFVLYELEGMSSPEIARLLDLPLGTVASRLRRARDRFTCEADRVRAHLASGGRS
jgi:RNA polymerase sigma-70 factor (ECF subfamily)